MSCSVINPIKRILVTGGSGFVGRYLLPVLLNDFPGVEVHATSQTAVVDEESVVWHQLDICDANAVEALVADVQPDVVLHLAAQSNVALSFSQPSNTWDVNLHGSLNIQRALAEIGRGLLMQIGSADMYGASFRLGEVDENAILQPLNPYSASKAAADLAAYALSQTSNIHVIRCRPFNHTGAGQGAGFVVSGFAQQIAEAEKGLREPVIKVGDLTAERDFLHVSDVVAAYSAVIKHHQSFETGAAVNICSGLPVSISTMLGKLVGLSHVSLDVQVEPQRFRKSDIPCVQGNANRLRSVTGWSEQVGHVQMLSSVLEYWRDFYSARFEKRL